MSGTIPPAKPDQFTAPVGMWGTGRVEVVESDPAAVEHREAMEQLQAALQDQNITEESPNFNLVVDYHETRDNLERRQNKTPKIFGKLLQEELVNLDAQFFGNEPDTGSLGVELATQGVTSKKRQTPTGSISEEAYKTRRHALIHDAKQGLGERFQEVGQERTSENPRIVNKVKDELVACGIEVNNDATDAYQMLAELSDEDFALFAFHHVERFEAQAAQTLERLPDLKRDFLSGADRLIESDELPLTHGQLRKRHNLTRVAMFDYLYTPQSGHYDPSRNEIAIDPTDSAERQYHTYVHESVHAVAEYIVQPLAGGVPSGDNLLTRIEHVERARRSGRPVADLDPTTSQVVRSRVSANAIAEWITESKAQKIDPTPAEDVLYDVEIFAGGTLSREHQKALESLYFQGAGTLDLKTVYSYISDSITQFDEVAHMKVMQDIVNEFYAQNVSIHPVDEPEQAGDPN